MAYTLVFFEVSVIEVLSHPAPIAPIEIPFAFIFDFLPTSRSQNVKYHIVERAFKSKHTSTRWLTFSTTSRDSGYPRRTGCFGLFAAVHLLFTYFVSTVTTFWREMRFNENHVHVKVYIYTKVCIN